MITARTYRRLIWIIVILLATNLSMGLSFWFHKQQESKVAEQVEMPSEQRTRFFREQLNLQTEQMDIFRNLNRDYNRSARRITIELEALRLQMVEEMGKSNPDEETLKDISEKIGQLHTDLKNKTIAYYLGMKAECNEEQQQKLNALFKALLESKEDVELPEPGKRGRGRYAEE